MTTTHTAWQIDLGSSILSSHVQLQLQLDIKGDYGSVRARALPSTLSGTRFNTFPLLGSFFIGGGPHPSCEGKVCTNDCGESNGVCEDGGDFAVSQKCARGTDCLDCGPRTVEGPWVSTTEGGTTKPELALLIDAALLDADLNRYFLSVWVRPSMQHLATTTLRLVWCRLKLLVSMSAH
eukprot:608571-Pleurochrysis_carterae.AAC.6